jgi:hypothetical protein
MVINVILAILFVGWVVNIANFALTKNSSLSWRISYFGNIVLAIAALVALVWRLS